MVLFIAACSGDAGSSGGVDAGDDVDAGGCAPGSGPTYHSGVIDSDETWTAATSPHVVRATGGRLVVRNGATLTIEPCVEVRLEEGASITVGEGGEAGHLVAVGTAAQPIAFRDDGARWDQLLVEAPGELRLAYATFTGGGGDSITYDGATIVVDGDSEPPLDPIAFVDHVRVENSAGYGILVRRTGAFVDGSADLVVTGSGADLADAPAPVLITAEAIGTLPEGDYTGNAVDEIRIEHGPANSAITVDTTFAGRGVPYHAPEGITVARAIGAEADPAPTLTVEPGVTIQFGPGSELAIGTDTIDHGTPGGLNAVGTADAPIVFTSDAESPAAGDWVGIVFREPPQGATNALEHAVIEYAGGDCSCGGWSCPAVLSGDDQDLPEDAAVLIYSWPPPASFMTNCTIRHSAGWGVLRGWTGAAIDFEAGNTFEDVAYCAQTTPQSPGAEPCPGSPYTCTP
ncbi:MAG: hypothetical protein D6689_08070 [Deltaproteobacteria bacterium]|nr:MAG: hypothetical protein D6689_08070 [Deltaproteobacteria bacterium]